MQIALGLGYKNRSQIARVVTEAWGAENLYCPKRDASQLQQVPANTRAIDFGCDVDGQVAGHLAANFWAGSLSSALGSLRFNDEPLPAIFVVLYTHH
jgi:hypothetical protein